MEVSESETLPISVQSAALLELAAALAEGGVKPQSFLGTSLLEAGIVEVPLEVEADGRRYGVYYYPEATARTQLTLPVL